MNTTPNTNPGGQSETPDELIQQASSIETSKFDFIIVGSGAGGGPLACRLALADKRVLLIEAGQDPKSEGEVHDAPGYHGASTENPAMSWQFSVRHYESDARQALDHKYDRTRDPSSGSLDPTLPGSPPKGTPGKGGIFYPRSSGIGGCTSHHAMIVIRPNDSDWEHIADLTNDDSWRAKNMQPYFAKFEQCLYIDKYRGFLGNILGFISRAFSRIVRFLNPKSVLDRGGHGDSGWQPTSFIAPELVERIVATDNEFATVLLRSATKAVGAGGGFTAWIKRRLALFGIVRSLDPNDLSNRAESAKGGVFLIPTGIGGGDARDENGDSLKGRRAGVREFILKTQEAHPDRLVIARGIHVKRVLFDETVTPPRAIGVLCEKGDHLYKASPLRPGTKAKGEEKMFYIRQRAGEVILCGGSFNTPQMLMLSGIGDEQELKALGIDALGKPVHLPGVGKNLQDRYEVGVISELRDDLKTLDTVSFTPGDPDDRARAEWIAKKEGLYATNGGTIAILRQSAFADRNEPDLFTFGAPAAFRGYYWNWSRELFKPALGAANDQHNLWTWVILKAYTRNNGGTVRLRSNDPFDTPEINFHSFDDGATKDWKKDVEAITEAVESMRAINGRPGSPFAREIQPEGYLAAKNAERKAAGLPEWKLGDWIQNEAWGHHACGTCRIGADPWRADTAELTDKGAVLDSHFRVHGVSGLRIVDASVFPKIPGYFILAPIFMVSEKAAETILREHCDENYPEEIRDIETAAIRRRRLQALVSEDNEPVPPGEAAAKRDAASANPAAGAPEKPVKNAVGVAFSGGGVRSATFSLGVLQAIAAKGRLRQVDYLSSVSGGGFTGSFLGRLFMRARVKDSGDPAGRAQDLLKDDKSGPLRWLRTQANYLFASGTDDWLLALGIFFRNLFTVHLVIGALLLTLFGTLAGISPSVNTTLGFASPEVRLEVKVNADAASAAATPAADPKCCDPCEDKDAQKKPKAAAAPARMAVADAKGQLKFGQPDWMVLSAWWWLPLAVLGLAIIPMKLGYWLAPKMLSYRSHPPHPFAAWIILLAGASAGLALPGRGKWAGAAIVVLALAWLWQEIARRGLPEGDVKERRIEGVIVRNRLSRGVGEALIIFAALLVWAVLDTLAGSIASRRNLPGMIAALAALAPGLQALRSWGAKVLPKGDGPSPFTLMKMAAVVLALALLFLVDVIAHGLFAGGDMRWAWGIVFIALLFSLALGRAFDFLNLTSLHTTYASRITRTYLGASNEARSSSPGNIAADVSASDPRDDMPHCRYRPEEHGGPLHLISVCVNETVDHASQREIRESRGLPMTVGSFGVSVGRRYFAKWTRDNIRIPRWLRFRRRLEGMDGEDGKVTARPALEALRLNSDPNTFHPLARRDGSPAVVQSLSLGDWVAVSGAAFSTGRGRATNPLEALFMGLVNVRLGFWWGTGTKATERPGRFPANAWRRLKELPGMLFRAQQLLFAEWRARFDGPSMEFWNLTDGGHMDNSALYELVRRRLPFIICTDATCDANYSYDDFAIFVRSVRVDFDAEVTWMDPQTAELPEMVGTWVKKEALGKITDIGGNPANKEHTGTKHAAIARIAYNDGTAGWLLFIKASLTAGDSLDVIQYAKANTAFPQDSTADQVFDDAQWESYRKLGFDAAFALLHDAPKP